MLETEMKKLHGSIIALTEAVMHLQETVVAGGAAAVAAAQIPKVKEPSLPAQTPNAPPEPAAPIEVKQPAPQQEPTPAPPGVEAYTYTKEQVLTYAKQACTTVGNANVAKIGAVFGKHGASHIDDLKPEHYSAVVKDIEQVLNEFQETANGA